MCFDDAWVWPSGNNYLFPDRTAKSHMKKDAVCHAITKARKSFGKCTVISPEKIRSPSGRHTMINALKNSSIPADVGMCFSRITHKRTYDMYGQLDQAQTGSALNSSKRLKKTLKAVYS